MGKAQPYFEQKEAFNKTLEAQKAQVQQLQSKVSIAKVSFPPFKNIRSSKFAIFLEFENPQNLYIFYFFSN